MLYSKIFSKKFYLSFTFCKVQSKCLTWLSNLDCFWSFSSFRFPPLISCRRGSDPLHAGRAVVDPWVYLCGALVADRTVAGVRCGHFDFVECDVPPLCFFHLAARRVSDVAAAPDRRVAQFCRRSLFAIRAPYRFKNRRF